MTDFLLPKEDNKRTDEAVSLAATATSAVVAPLVFLIERDDDARFMLKTLLEMWGCRVAADGGADEEAAIARVAVARPDAILLDITLQYMDGIKTMRRLRRQSELERVPIIFFSGHAQPALRSVILALGGSDLFVKPVDFDGLRQSLGSHTARAGFGGLAQ